VEQAPAAHLSPGHPIRVRVDDDLRRSRLTVFFRLILAIPHFIWLYLWGIVAALAAIANWFATLFAGRSPDGLHTFLAVSLRYYTHVSAYLSLLADPYPGFTGNPGYPIDLDVDGPQPQNRWVTGFRLILAIPAFIVTGVLQQVRQVVAVLAWFVCLALGQLPEGMRNLGVYCLRYELQTYGYVALLTDRYPSFAFPRVE
jgi:hypothetical protein